MDVMTDSQRLDLERRILQTYILLLHKKHVDGARMASLVRYGRYEVRLMEPAHAPKSDIIAFWIELFDHVSGSTLDSYASDNVEDAAAATEAMVSHARQLHEDSTKA
jgi:hypothetical protein